MTRADIRAAYYSEPQQYLEEHLSGSIYRSSIWDQEDWNLENLNVSGFQISLFENSPRSHTFTWVDGNSKFLHDFFPKYLRNPTLQDWKCVQFTLEPHRMRYYGEIMRLVWLRNDPAIAIDVSMRTGSPWYEEFCCEIRLTGSFKFLIEYDKNIDCAYIVENCSTSPNSREYDLTITQIVQARKTRTLHHAGRIASFSLFDNEEKKGPDWTVCAYASA